MKSLESESEVDVAGGRKYQEDKTTRTGEDPTVRFESNAQIQIGIREGRPSNLTRERGGSRGSLCPSSTSQQMRQRLRGSARLGRSSLNSPAMPNFKEVALPCTLRIIKQFSMDLEHFCYPSVTGHCKACGFVHVPETLLVHWNGVCVIDNTSRRQTLET